VVRTRQKIIDPFFSIAARGQQLRRELTVAKAGLQDRGGWINGESVVGEGSPFRIRLPARAEGASVTLIIPTTAESGMNERGPKGSLPLAGGR
jgi:hypothetical protein